MARSPAPGSSPVLVVGAGLSGMACAEALVARGVPVEILEKSRGVGGRVATRHFDAQPFEYGAPQLECADGSDLFAALGPLRDEQRLSPRGLRGLIRAVSDGALAHVHTHVRAASIAVDEAGVACTTTDGRVFRGRALVVAIPAPQAVTLLGPLAPAPLTEVRYRRGLVVALEGAGEVGLPPGLHALASAAWSRVGRRTHAHGEVIHVEAADSAWQRAEAPEADDDVVERCLRELTEQGILRGFRVRERFVKRWTFARPENRIAGRAHLEASPGRVWVVGDAFGASPTDVASAWASGGSAARAILASDHGRHA